MVLGIISPTHNEEGIKKVREYGLDYAEFDINADDISYIDSTAIKNALDKYNVKIGAVGRWGRNRLNPDQSINTKEQKDEFDLIDYCADWGCPVYITGVNYLDNLSYYQNISLAIEYFDSLIKYSNGRVKICTYNCSWNNYVDKPYEWKIVHGHLKDLGIKFDPSHTVNGHRDYLEEAVEYGNIFDHVHLKGTLNINGKRIDDPPAGMDMINWGALMAILYKQGYKGMLSIEPHSEVWQGELGKKGILFTIEYFKKLLF